MLLKPRQEFLSISLHTVNMIDPACRPAPFRIDSTLYSTVRLPQFRRSATWSVHIDTDLTMRSRVVVTVRSCFAAQRHIRSVRQTLVVSNVDYCPSVVL